MITVTAENEEDEITVLLDNVSITGIESKSPVTLSGSGKVTLILKGENTLENVGTTTTTGQPGIYKGESGTLVIKAYDGDASLTATGGGRSAGIGGKYDSGYRNAANIYIESGKITAAGTTYGAGIGGGYNGTGSNINISGGTVVATAGGDGVSTTVMGGGAAAGIGGGSSGAGSNINISGGTVIATGSVYGAGIGGGNTKAGSDISITGGTVTAKSYGADGIGSGKKGSSASGIVIDKASVLASSIGCGPVNSDGDSVYLYTIPDTEEGSSIYVDGSEFISGVVHHSDDDSSQYLYLTSASKKAEIPDGIDEKTVYSLSYESGSEGVVSEGSRIVTLNKDNTELELSADTNVVTEGISVVTGEGGVLSGIKVDTGVYGGDPETAAYLDIVGVSVDGVFYQLENYYYYDEAEQYAFFPVSGETSKTSQRVRGVAGTKESADGEEVVYYVTSGSDGLTISAE